MFLIGDVHGEFLELQNKIIRYRITDENLIQLGDFGCINNLQIYQEFAELNKFLNDRNNILYIIRGNHDNPLFFKPNFLNFTNIKFVEDFTILNIENQTIFCIGGGISIDRIYRKENVNYWTKEKIEYNLDKVQNITCDIVLTHVPFVDLFTDIKSIFLTNWIKTEGQTLVNDLVEERQYLNFINRNINFKKWVAGHLHKSKFTNIDNKEYRILDILEFYQI